MLAALNDLKSERILSKFGGGQTFIGNVNNDRVGDNILSVFKNCMVLISDGRDWVI
jgi:hypothetical protein